LEHSLLEKPRGFMAFIARRPLSCLETGREEPILPSFPFKIRFEWSGVEWSRVAQWMEIVGIAIARVCKAWGFGGIGAGSIRGIPVLCWAWKTVLLAFTAPGVFFYSLQ
jgi:hypothetical protein